MEPLTTTSSTIKGGSSTSGVGSVGDGSWSLDAEAGGGESGGVGGGSDPSWSDKQRGGGLEGPEQLGSFLPRASATSFSAMPVLSTRPLDDGGAGFAAGVSVWLPGIGGVETGGLATMVSSDLSCWRMVLVESGSSVVLPTA